MWLRSMVVREGQQSTWLPPEPRYQAAEHGLVRVVVDLLAASLTSQSTGRDYPVELVAPGRLPDLKSSELPQLENEHSCRR